MSAAVEFTPNYEHPFTLEQAILLEIDILVAEIGRLQNSIQHLQSTQTELQAFIDEDPANDDDEELSKAVKENEDTIASQTERITLIKVALLNKVGEGGVKHYGLELPPSDQHVVPNIAADPPASASTNDPPLNRPALPTPQAISETDPTEDEGLHL